MTEQASQAKSEAAPFAHLLGLPPAPQAAAPAPSIEGDDDDKKRDGESDEDYDKRKKSKKAKAEKEADEECRRVAAEAERLDNEQGRGGESPEQKARAEERARCRSIFVHPAAAKRPDVAATLAFDTNMTRGEAIRVLASTATEKPGTKGPGLGERMSAERVPEVQPEQPGTEKDPKDPKSVAAAVIAAAAKARGDKQ